MLVPLLALVLVFLVVALLFGNSPALRSTPLHRIYLVLVRVNAAVVRYATASPSVYAVLRWLVPAFYIAVVSFCLYVFFAEVYPQLRCLGIVGLGHATCIAFTVVMVAVATELAIFSDPGVLTRAHLDASVLRYPNNGLIFFGRQCRTCQWQKPARSKHCSVCDRCVLRFDHHCIWINNCVGQNNYRWFVAYLVANIHMMAYGGYLCWRLLAAQDRGGGMCRVIVASTPSNKAAGVLMILGTIFSVITLAFAALHVRYMYLGVTTNEADKWGEVEYLVQLGALFWAPDMGVYLERASVSSNGLHRVVYISLDDESIVLDENDERKHALVQVTLVAELINRYDRGFWNNVYERIWE